jgi:hypothetical protein
MIPGMPWAPPNELMPEISINRGGIQFNAASPSVTGAAITAPAGWQRPVIYPTRKEAKQFVSDFEEAYPTFLGWVIRKKAEETAMRNDQDILTQAEELRAEAERLEKIVAEREKYGADPFKNGTVLKVEMRYRTGTGRSFAYGVVKVAGKFYLTGKLINANTVGSDAARGFTWEQFVAWLSQGDATVWQAKSLTQVF